MKKLIILSITLCFSFNLNSQNLVDLYKKVNSSVVVIHTLNSVSAGSGDKQKVNTEGGQGSGVLISADGLIWTASHVVHTADEVIVKFNDNDTYKATVVSTNPLADVALIKIESGFELKNKHVAVIGDSNKVMIGEDIFVIGAPLGVEQTLSKGIVSGRTKPDNSLGENFMPVEYLQTDAAINPGNSGGPMFNMKGEVIAIASFILSKSGGFEGIGYGATSNIAKKVLMERRNLWSGMEFIFLENEMADVFNIPQEAGLLVLTVSSKGLGSKIGLRGGYINATIEGTDLLIGGDIILEVAGVKLDNPLAIIKLREKLTDLTKKESYFVKYFREGKERIVVVRNH